MTDQEREERLAAARAKKAAAAAKRAELETKRAPDDELRREETEAEDEQAIADAEEEHGPVGEGIAYVKTLDGVVIVKRPNALFFKKISIEATSKSTRKIDEAGQRLVAHCLVYPPKDRYEALVEKFARVPEILVGQIAALAEGRATTSGE